MHVNIKNTIIPFLLFFVLINQKGSWAQTLLIDPNGAGGFEVGNSFASNGWTESQNGNNSANKWKVGNASVQSGVRAAYITNDNGVTNAYTLNDNRTQHFYRDITFPASQTIITLTFKWKGMCEGAVPSSDLDNLKVFLVNTNVNPGAGNQLAAAGQIGATWYNLQSTWQTATITINAANAGISKRLVFSFKCNNSGGTQPPIALDSISLTSALPPMPPRCAGISAPANGSMLTCNATSATLAWTAPSSGTPASSYKVFFGTNNPPTNILNGTNVGNILSLNMGGLIGNTTYYWTVVPTNAQGDATGCAVWSFNSTAIPTNDDPCSAIALPVNPTCNLNNYSNSCATNTSGVPTPQCANYLGGDVWYKALVPLSGALQIESAAGVLTDGAMEVYSGTCSSLIYIACDNNGSFMPQLTLTGLTPNSTIYIRFWEEGNNNNGTFQLCVTDLCPGTAPPINDQPCNAQLLQLGVNTEGSISACASVLNEPTPPPSCWINGAVNTVWYSVVAATSSLHIRCNPGTLSDPQIALYSGTCGSSLAELGCNNNGPACGSFSYFSDFTVSGLTPGLTYYIAVDGVLDLVGTFNIVVVSGAVALPIVPGQDCGSFQTVCSQSFSVANPGFTGFGNICDFDGTGANCLDAGERASAWYEITIASNGNLEFDIVPTDWPGSPSTTCTDYDFAVWKTGGSGAVTCANIAAGSVPLRCNFSSLGVTGLWSSNAGANPPAYPGFGAAFEKKLSVNAGEKYVIVISNYLTSTSGFTINFSNGSNISYGTGTNATVYWSGTTDNDWFKPTNWGGCAIPTCTTNAVISSATNPPVINAAGAACQSLTINAGGILSLKSPQTLTICENYLNNGTLVAQAGAMILFNNGSVVQQISGNLTETSAFPNLEINKTGGFVQLNQHLDVKGFLNIANATSTFNVNTKNIKVTGNFTNLGLYTVNSPGLLEFNGSGSQQYNNAGLLANVRLNHTGPGVSLFSNLSLNNTAILTLDTGKIITNANEVQINNRNINTISAGSASSYIEGKLRRYINTQGSYDFPVGNSSKGYQRANLNFKYPAVPTTIDNLLASFTTHPSLPGPLGIIDCSVTFSSDALDNGYWSFAASNTPTSGNFDLTLYNRSYTNAANGWTIMQNDGTGWGIANGLCQATPVTAVVRLSMNGIYNFGTTQTTSTPLPVEWLYINARGNRNSISVDWATASEEDNSGFEVYSSINQHDFSKIGWVDGHGNSGLVNKYSFEDAHAKPGVNYYYKLHQIDYNGNYKESKIVTARYNINAISISPNPVINQSVISFHAESTKVKLDIIRTTGELVKILLDGVEKDGSQTYILDPATIPLSPGCYIVRLIDAYSVKHVSFCYIK